MSSDGCHGGVLGALLPFEEVLYTYMAYGSTSSTRFVGKGIHSRTINHGKLGGTDMIIRIRTKVRRR